ncbi:hypothetical protein cypCar_00050266, partial [Cyprinus carpio]
LSPVIICSSSGCYSKVYIYKKTSVPGVFTYYSTRHRRVKDVTVVETNYTEYALVLKHKKFNKEFTQVALYGESAINNRYQPKLFGRAFLFLWLCKLFSVPVISL